MGATKFTSLVGDGKAGGGALRGAPAYILPTDRFQGFYIDGFTESGLTLGPTGKWTIVAIGASVTPGISLTNRASMIFASHNAAAASIGADFTYGDSAVASTVIAQNFEYCDQDATRPFMSENGFEVLFRFGNTSGIAADHATWMGFNISNNAATFLNTAGAFVETTNFCGWYNNGATLSGVAVGNSGAVQTFYSQASNLTDGAMFYLGFRFLGRSRFEYYINRRLVGNGKLANPMGAGANADRFTFGISNVGLSTGAGSHNLRVQRLTFVSTYDSGFVPTAYSQY